jgi:transposase InsO family protein
VLAQRTHRLMRAAGLRCVHPKPYKCTTTPGRFNPALADLLRRDWSSPEPNLAWAGDITYVRIWTGWAFLTGGLRQVASVKLPCWVTKLRNRVATVSDWYISFVMRRLKGTGT